MYSTPRYSPSSTIINCVRKRRAIAEWTTFSLARYALDVSHSQQRRTQGTTRSSCSVLNSVTLFCAFPWPIELWTSVLAHGYDVRISGQHKLSSSPAFHMEYCNILTALCAPNCLGEHLAIELTQRSYMYMLYFLDIHTRRGSRITDLRLSSSFYELD